MFAHRQAEFSERLGNTPEPPSPVHYNWMSLSPRIRGIHFFPGFLHGDCML
jgi:hypothetical protein